MTDENRLAAMLGAHVEDGAIAGAAALIWRGGKVVDRAAVGWRDREAGLPILPDTIFRIASMTKPVTAAAALMLLEEGAFALDDPIARWAPEFAAMRVLRAPDGPLDETDPATRPITFEDLLTHRSGLTYGDFHTGPIAAAYSKRPWAATSTARSLPTTGSPPWPPCPWSTSRAPASTTASPSTSWAS